MITTLSAPEGRLANKVVIITSLSTGLRPAIALAYGREGAKVVCADITSHPRPEIEHDATARTLKLLHKEDLEVTSFKADVSKAEDVKALER